MSASWPHLPERQWLCRRAGNLIHYSVGSFFTGSIVDNDGCAFGSETVWRCQRRFPSKRLSRPRLFRSIFHFHCVSFTFYFCVHFTFSPLIWIPLCGCFEFIPLTDNAGATAPFVGGGNSSFLLLLECVFRLETFDDVDNTAPSHKFSDGGPDSLNSPGTTERFFLVSSSFLSLLGFEDRVHGLPR